MGWGVRGVVEFATGICGNEESGTEKLGTDGQAARIVGSVRTSGPPHHRPIGDFLGSPTKTIIIFLVFFFLTVYFSVHLRLLSH